MNRRKFLAGMTALAAVSCSRMDRRAPRYDEKQCPFCTTSPGTCSYCAGTKKCTFCGGTGKRKTVWTDMPEEKISSGSYPEQCPYCKGTGTCRYCNGGGKCWACKGKATVTGWNFYDESKQQN
jgi:hypothetical protein